MLPEHYKYQGDTLYCEDVALADIAGSAGTPCYVYSANAILGRYRAYEEALAGVPHRVCYSVKANSNLGVLGLMARAGAGFDIVSGGELHRVLRAGADPAGVVFSGVGKTADEVEAAIAAGIHIFCSESEAELTLIDAIAARLGRRARIAVRANPDIDAATHPYISTGLRENKFGVAVEDALRLYRTAHASRHLQVVGIDFHVGSQLTEVAPFVAALDKALEVVDALEREGIALHHIDLGGGLGIRYRDEHPPSPQAYLGPLLDRLAGRPQQILLEPGRTLVGNAGLLLTRVEYLKDGPDRNFAIVDAAMNDLLRPALYDA